MLFRSLAEWFDLEFAEGIDPDQARQRLQAELPVGLTLHAVRTVPVQGPSLSQELRAAQWWIELLPAEAAWSPSEPTGRQPEPPWPGPERWRRAIDDLLARQTLLWEDTDKKGRPRQRDCRPYLQSLELVALRSDPQPAMAEMCFEAAIDPQGRSLRPEQLRAWIGEGLGMELRLGRLRRLALTLMA